ncbi:MAG TPA: hypothetical protein VMZ52_04825 [Bryobacteraceae bacterium]|nr:hypothetical protein [Bryobacteraceae bacterium]
MRAYRPIPVVFNTMLLPFSDLLQKLPLPRMKRFQKAKEKLEQIIYAMIREGGQPGWTMAIC